MAASKPSEALLRGIRLREAKIAAEKKARGQERHHRKVVSDCYKVLCEISTARAKSVLRFAKSQRTAQRKATRKGC